MSGFVCRKHTLQAGVSIFAFDIHEKVNMAMSEIHNTNVPGTHYLAYLYLNLVHTGDFTSSIESSYFADLRLNGSRMNTINTVRVRS